MRAREVTAATVATLTLAVAVGCAASATVSSYLRGTWSCTSTGMEEPITVDVKDGTFALASGEERVTGTWDIAFGDLNVTMDGQGQFDLATAAGFPAADADPAGGYTGAWTPGYSDGGTREPGQMEVRVDGGAVRIQLISLDGHLTTTTCTKE